FSADDQDIGIALQGGCYNTVIRALNQLGLADIFGNSKIPLYVMNVAYPLVEDEYERFCRNKRAILVLEEGQPNFVEQNVANILRQYQLTTQLHGKDLLPMAGEYNTATVLAGIRSFLERYGCIEPQVPAAAKQIRIPLVNVVPDAVNAAELAPLEDAVHARPPGFCTGCPERPIFTAMKLIERELGPHHISADIGCHLFSILPPFNLGNTTMGYGLGGAGSAALNAPSSKRAIAVMGDGGFWHNGLTSGIANSVFNRSDNLTIVVDNSYTSATGGQDILSSTAENPTRSTGHEIENAVKGVGVKWVKTIKRTYDLKTMTSTLREALTTTEKGPKVLIAQSECMLNKQRREKQKVRKAIASGERVVRERFGVDPDTCTGDHSCIRLSGCPSLTIKPNQDPLRTDPVASVIDSCVGCGLCGEVSHAAVLCPSFYRAQIITHPNRWERLRHTLRNKIIGWMQHRDSQRHAQLNF
ncbi:MAG: indolepyruvate ferredoxin oxidoreductase subunit alpha, partial [Hafnia sp.]